MKYAAWPWITLRLTLTVGHSSTPLRVTYDILTLCLTLCMVQHRVLGDTGSRREFFNVRYFRIIKAFDKQGKKQNLKYEVFST